MTVPPLTSHRRYRGKKFEVIVGKSIAEDRDDRYSHEGVVSQAVIAISSSYVYPFVRLDATIPSSRPALPDTGARSDRPAPSRGVPPAAPRGWDGRRWPVASTLVS